MSATPIRLVVMGVAGVGRTTVRERVAEAIGLPSIDADTLRPAENVARMRAGLPLGTLNACPGSRPSVDRWRRGPAVVACSALRWSYGHIIRRSAPDAVFVHLTADSALVEQRIAARHGHIMPESLLTSQLATLEPLSGEERGSAVENRLPLDQVIKAITRSLPSAAGATHTPTGATA